MNKGYSLRSHHLKVHLFYFISLWIKESGKHT